MKQLISFLLLLLSLCVSAQNLEVTEGQGLSAFYYGTIGNEVFVAGGSNFPGVPCAEGGAKHYYDEVRVLTSSGQWEVRGHLPISISNGASAVMEDGILCVGGQDSIGPYSRAFILHSDATVEDLPFLPIALKDHAVAYYRGKAYVLGGPDYFNVLCLDFSHLEEGWKVIAHLPGTERQQPIAIVQTGATTPCLYIFGGYSTQQGVTTCHTDGLCLNLTTLQWTLTAPIPGGRTLVGSTAARSGYSHILCMGGVDKQRFQDRMNDPNPSSDYFSHPSQWYRFSATALVYHTVTNSWFTLAENPLYARAGAGLVSLGEGRWLYLMGESKPGIRSTEVTEVRVQQEVSFGLLNWTVLFVYLIAMLVLGYVFMKRESGADDFFRGGGRIPWWAAGISIYATMLSALTYMSIPAKAYATNWTYYIMLVTILPISFPVIRYYLPYFRRLNITSAYEYLEIRFNLATRLLASGLFIIFMVARMALVLYLPSLALMAVTGIDVQVCIVLMGIVTIIYCTMGGVEAVVWGDVVQGIILVGGAFFLAGWLILHTEGGAEGYLQIALDNDKMRLIDWSMDYRSVTFWVAIIGGLANNLISYTSDQTVIQRYLTTKDEKSAARSILMNAVMCICVSIVFYIIGTGLYTFFQTHPDHLDITMTKGDAILPYFMMREMPQGIAGLLIAAIFAATMSTISSNINSISTAFSIDFWHRFRPQTTDASMLRVARYTCLLSGVIGVGIALLMATWDILSLLDYFNSILGLLTGGLGGLFLIGVFFPSIKGKAALAGFISGTSFVFWLQYCTDANLFLYGAAGIAVSVIVAGAASKVFPENKRE